MPILEQPMTFIPEHEQVPIGFLVRSRLSLEALRRGEFVEEPVEPRWKDYDADPESLVSVLAEGFDTRHWSILAALDGERRVAGAVVARDTPGLDLLEGRSDLCSLLDIRVHPDARGRGVGRSLFVAACDWAARHGCTELKVETQDVNVGACRFYAAMGCRLATINVGAYRPKLDEAQLFWRRRVEYGRSCVPGGPVDDGSRGER